MKNAARPWFRRWYVELLVRLVYWCGLLHLFGLFRKYAGQKRLIILLYHRLTPPGGNAAIGGVELDAGVPADRFEQHLRLVRVLGEPMGLSDAVRWLYDERPSRIRTAVAITFDDGYLDNYELGRPAWRSRQIPVTLFPAVQAIEGRRWLWWDELAQTFAESTKDTPEAVDHARAAFNRIVSLDCNARDKALDELRRDAVSVCVSTSTRAPSQRLYMNWCELSELANEGVEIGGHTIRHARLPVEDLATVTRETSGCRTILSERVGQSIGCFAYPGGFHSPREIAALQRAGYTAAVTVTKGINDPLTDRFALRRIAVSWDGPHHLALKLLLGRWLF